MLYTFYILLNDIVQVIFCLVLISYCGLFIVLSFTEILVSLQLTSYKLHLIANTRYTNLFIDVIAYLKL